MLHQRAMETGVVNGRSCPGFRQRERKIMGTTELVILIVVLMLVFGGGGGYYYNRRGR
jgi:hypothetical protein